MPQKVVFYHFTAGFQKMQAVYGTGFVEQIAVLGRQQREEIQIFRAVVAGEIL